MWDRFEARYEAEHYLGPEVRAYGLVGRFTAGGEPRDTAAFREAIEALPWADLRAVYNQLVTLAGGPAKLGELSQRGWNAASPADQRVADLLRAVHELVGQHGPGPTELTPADIQPVTRCRQIDVRVADVLRRVYAGQAGPRDVTTLAAAQVEYRAVLARARVSVGGRRLLMGNAARLLDCLGRAAETLRDDEAAERNFAAASREYAAAGDEPQARASADRAAAAAQRRLPDADNRLRRLLARLDAAPASSLARADALLGLAELADGNGDAFEAVQRVDAAAAELTGLGYAPPAADGVPAAVTRWVDAVPAGSDDDPTHFERTITTVLTLQGRLAALRMSLAPGDGEAQARLRQEAEAQVTEISDITTDMQRHTAAVTSRLRTRLGGQPQADSVRADGPGGTAAADMKENLEIMGQVNALLDASGALPDDPQTLARLTADAAACVQRARKLGQPLVTAQALEAEARILVVARDAARAVPLLEEAYALVVALTGRVERYQVVLTASTLAKTYMELTPPDFQAAETAAARAIDLIERDRYRISAPFQQAAYLSAHLDVLSIGIFCAWQRGDFDTMLQRMELAKARASVRGLMRADGAVTDAPEAADSPDVPGLSEADLDRELRELAAAIHSPIPEQEKQALRARRLRLWDMRAVARRRLTAAMPPVTVAAVQAALDPDEIVLYYYFLRPTTLLVTTIDAHEVVVERIALGDDGRAKLDRLIEVLGSLTGSNLSMDKAFIEPLGARLMPEQGRGLLAGKRRLIVSAHRLLHWYPFAAMGYEGGPLIASLSVRHVPNLTSLVMPRGTPPGKAAPTRTAGVVVSEFPGRETVFPPLPRARDEAQYALALYRAAGRPAVLLSEPTREQFAASVASGTLTDTWCLHVATHGHSVADDVSKDAPMESTLELSDGPIDGFEIAAANLRSEVAILAACDAGQLAIKGRGMTEQPGDEMFGLPAAFLESGCGSVLAPIWPADDKAIAQVIISFHRHLAAGAAADLALARALRQYLAIADPKQRHAYYWAPLQLITVGRPASASPASALDLEEIRHG
jgi:CHAT domain-containing protein